MSRAGLLALITAALFLLAATCLIGNWAERGVTGLSVPKFGFLAPKKRSTPAFRSLLPERAPEDAPPGTVIVRGRGKKIEVLRAK